MASARGLAVGQPGLFDIERRLEGISAKGDPLETIKVAVPWEAFRAELAAVYAVEPTSNLVVSETRAMEAAA